jgi:hypothetical protein
MRPLLAVIVLFAAQNSLLATLVYRYEFSRDGVRPQGEEGSGYIDFLTPTGNNVPVLDAVYDLQFRGFVGRDGNGVFPDLPAPICSSLDGCGIFGFMSWTGTYLAGSWSITSPIARTEDGDFLSKSLITSATVESYWPLAYVFNEAMLPGRWQFTGTRNVPESGGTALNLTISAIVLAVLRWRHLNCSR